MVLPKPYPPVPIDYNDWNAVIDFLGEGINRYEARYVIVSDGVDAYAQNGVTGVIDYGGPNDYGGVDGGNPPAVIQAALDNLTAGRSWKEKVVILGNYTFTSFVDIPSYTTIEVCGRIEKGFVGSPFIILGTAPLHRTDIEIVGGEYDGKDGVYVDANPFFYPVYVNRILFRKCHFVDVHDYGIRPQANTCTYVNVFECYATGCFGLVHMDIVYDFLVSDCWAYLNDIDIRASGCLYGLVSNNQIYGDLLEGGGITFVGNSRFCHAIGNLVAFKGLEGMAIERSDYCSQIGNTLYRNLGGGIKNWDSNYNHITGNTLVDNYCRVPRGPGSDAPVAAQLSIYNIDPGHQSYHNVVRENYIIATGEHAPVPEYGIAEHKEAGAGPVNYNQYFDNKMVGHSIAPILLVGADTILPTIVVPFTFWYGASQSDSGVYIRNPGDKGGAWMWLPLNVQQVLKMKIHARSAVAEADRMRLEVNVRGGTDNESYTTHNAGIPNLPSTSVNFSADDIIYWTVTHADVLALLGGDSIEVNCVHEVAGNGDCDTDAYLRTAAIEYV